MVCTYCLDERVSGSQCPARGEEVINEHALGACRDGSLLPFHTTGDIRMMRMR